MHSCRFFYHWKGNFFNGTAEWKSKNQQIKILVNSRICVSYTILSRFLFFLWEPFSHSHFPRTVNFHLQAHAPALCLYSMQKGESFSRHMRLYEVASDIGACVFKWKSTVYWKTNKRNVLRNRRNFPLFIRMDLSYSKRKNIVFWLESA